MKPPRAVTRPRCVARIRTRSTGSAGYINENPSLRRSSRQNTYAHVNACRTRIFSDTSDGEQKDKEDLDEVSNELELADEDDLIPYLAPFSPVCSFTP